ncbi:MAG: zinc ribbon domain-containing protein [Oscillospiraceae bacterium]|nr:zinc ribbon domain-containing protein [Oscillospiraceae bacterium]
MFCRKCGAEISDSALSCPVCGTPVVSRTPKDGTRREATEAMRAAAQKARSEAGKTPASVIRRRRIIALVCALALLTAGIVIFIGNIPNIKYSRLMKNAAQALESGNDVEAAGELRKALELRPDSEEAETQLYAIWNNAMDETVALTEEDKYDEALVRGRTLAKIDPSREEFNRAALLVIYRGWASMLAQNGDAEGLAQLYAEAEADLKKAEIDTIRESADRTVSLLDCIARADAAALKFIDACSSDDTGYMYNVFLQLEKLESEYIELGGSYPYTFRDGDSGKGVVFRRNEGIVQAAAGNVSEDGELYGDVTVWYITEMGSTSQFICNYRSSWDSGAPNGETQLTEMGYSVEDTSDDIAISGKLSWGLWDGEVYRTPNGEPTFTLTYTKGMVKVLQKLEKDQNIVGYSSDGTRMIMFTDASVSSPHGVDYLG